MIAHHVAQSIGSRAQKASLAAAAATLLSVSGVSAQSPSGAPCALRSDFIRLMAHTYDESPIALGVTDDGRLIELFASRSGSTWSIALTTPSGITCLVMSGSEWQMRPAVADTGA
ncbi:MAG: hypothetical protein JNK67_15635 [Alphaproteobacteria bacterium]|nr:hypothetical protein [Alphaproteobacteria bacterium]